MAEAEAGSRVVVKVGSSSITRDSGEFDEAALDRLVRAVALAASEGRQITLVTSGAIAAGLPAVGFETRPDSVADLQVLAAVGQGLLMQRYANLFASSGLVVGQVLLTPNDFALRSSYLNARQALGRMLELGVIPVVNENDTVAVDEIRFGDNDRLAALVAHLVGAESLLILTDTAGLYTADPRLDSDASLIDEVVEIDRELEAAVGDSSSVHGSGGMASKLAAARMASWSGIRVVIASSSEDDVVRRILKGESLGTTVKAHTESLSSRKAWIAFGSASKGCIIVDDGARRALVSGGASLLPIGVRRVEGEFVAGDSVEVLTDGGRIFAKGIVSIESSRLAAVAGTNSADLPADVRHEVIHRDDLVVFPSSEPDRQS